MCRRSARWPLSFPFFIDGAKQAADDALMAQTFIAEPSNERRAAFLSAYARKFNAPLGVPMAAAQGYDTTYLLIYALFSIRRRQVHRPGGESSAGRTFRVCTTAWSPPTTSRSASTTKTP